MRQAPYLAVSRLWRDAWEQFTPFLEYAWRSASAVRHANAIESLNARYRRAVSVREHFPTPDRAGRDEVPLLGHQVALPKGTGQTWWMMRWKPALNAFVHLRRPDAQGSGRLNVKMRYAV